MYKTLLSIITVTSVIYAQDIDPSPLSTDVLTKPTLNDNDKRVVKNAVVAATETQLNKLKETEGARAEMFKRAQQLQVKRAAFLKDFADGKVRPFTHLVERWGEFEDTTERVQSMYTEYLSTEQGPKKDKLAGEILTLIQPLGAVLQNADHSGYELETVTSEQAAEIDQLMNDFNELSVLSDDSEVHMELNTPEIYYTLKHIPLVISFTAPEGTEIMLLSETGGSFANQYSYIRIIADENNVARTTWVSNGDGVSECSILYKSPAYPERGRITPIVKQLSLLPLEAISPVAETSLNQFKKLNKPSKP